VHCGGEPCQSGGFAFNRYKLGPQSPFYGKEDLFHSRIIGWLADKFGAFPVAKGKLNRRAGRTAVELLANGQALIIYPEGQRSWDGKLGPAYSGAALTGGEERCAHRAGRHHRHRTAKRQMVVPAKTENYI